MDYFLPRHRFALNPTQKCNPSKLGLRDILWHISTFPQFKTMMEKLMSSYSQLTEGQRQHIYALLKAGHKRKDIADVLGVHKSTISREFGRNKGHWGYRPEQGHHKGLERHRNATKATEMTPEVIDFLEEKLRLDWSPEQVPGWLAKQQGISISHECIYPECLVPTSTRVATCASS